MARRGASYARQQAAKKKAASTTYSGRSLSTREEALRRQAAERAAKQRGRAAEMNRRAQAEQAASAAAARKKRTTATASQRGSGRQRHVVTKTDTPESIGNQYGIDPSAVGEAAGVRLRAGQSIDIDPIRQEDIYSSKGYTDWAGRQAEGKARIEGTRSRADRILNFASHQEEEIRRQGADAINPPLWVAAGVPEDFYEELRGDPDFPETSTEEPFVDTQRAKDRAVLARIQDQYSQKKESDFQYQVRHEGAKWKYQQAQEAWFTADDDLRPDYFTDWELSLFSPTVQDRIIDELGYRRDEDGKWVPIEIQDEDYGMGGYNFPGYGTGGGGGALEALPSRGSSYRGYKTGGKTRRASKQLFAGNIPRSHWRL